jgi:hypothetical protein
VAAWKLTPLAVMYHIALIHELAVLSGLILAPIERIEGQTTAPKAPSGGKHRIDTDSAECGFIAANGRRGKAA